MNAEQTTTYGTVITVSMNGKLGGNHGIYESVFCTPASQVGLNRPRGPGSSRLWSGDGTEFLDRTGRSGAVVAPIERLIG